jgi:hypothetical protein
MPPQVLSQVPQLPPQQSLSCEQPSPSAAPDMPPQVLSQVPQAPPQQSESRLHMSPASAQPHVPLAHTAEQQSVSCEQESPSCAPDTPPQVLSQVPQLVPPQQSLSVWHMDPVLHGGPQVPLLQTKPSSAQQSVSTMHVSPSTPHEGFAHMPLAHTKVPQQSLSIMQVSPMLAQPHVPALQLFGAQQSLLCVHDAPAAAQPQVMALGSQVSPVQQGVAAAHAWPLVAQPMPAPQVMAVGSQVRPSQHPGAEGSQSPPCPAQAAWHFPLTQLLEQQSPLVLQQSMSSWQLGSMGVQLPMPLLLELE